MATMKGATNANTTKRQVASKTAGPRRVGRPRKSNIQAKPGSNGSAKRPTTPRKREQVRNSGHTNHKRAPEPVEALYRPGIEPARVHGYEQARAALNDDDLWTLTINTPKVLLAGFYIILGIVIGVIL